jgi:hypothetical protein
MSSESEEVKTDNIVKKGKNQIIPNYHEQRNNFKFVFPTPKSTPKQPSSKQSIAIQTDTQNPLATPKIV